MSEEEKKAIEKLKSIVKVHNDFMKDIKKEFISSEEIKALEIVLNLVENQQKELEHYKRLAEMNLKDSEEFKKNMCEHRCILNNEIMELTEELNNIKEIEQHHKADNGLLRQELDMQIEHNKELDNILYAKQSMIDELTQNEEKLKIELGKEKERNELFVVSGNSINLERHIKNNYISKGKIKELLENEIIDISGFKCIAVEDIENLLEEK